MRAHDSVNIIHVQSRLVKESSCKSTLTILVMDNQLSDPADNLVTNIPTAGKSIACKSAANGNSDIRGIALQKVVVAEFGFAESNGSI
jgi:hypothetical protein